MSCSYAQPEWFCEKEQGHDGPHEMYVGWSVVTPSRTDRQPPNPVAGAKGGQQEVEAS